MELCIDIIIGISIVAAKLSQSLWKKQHKPSNEQEKRRHDRMSFLLSVVGVLYLLICIIWTHRM